MQVSDMSNIKLDEVVCRDFEESELSSWKGKVTSDENVNRVYEILNTIHKEGQRSLNSITANVENGTRHDRLFKGIEKHAHVVGRRSGALMSGTAYCISSCSMILLNKVVLSSYNFNAGISLMLYQNLIACLVVAILGLCGAVSIEKLNWRLIRVWIPVNIIFVGMLVSGMYRDLCVIVLQIISAVSGGITDLSFDATGNVIRLPMFWVVATASGLLGLAISFTSMWFLHQTGPTTYSLVGSLNKIPISIAGLALFKVPLSVPNLFSILFGNETN
ncbi:hypothetical protein V6N12_064740 [Hibiscus sabdariffa]|uniref:Uncharacterized protein n=1 Tax=Hibiscus sabdariffa TaxID=183260 RepID=A0ABR2G6U9_9ROSI